MSGKVETMDDQQFRNSKSLETFAEAKMPRPRRKAKTQNVKFCSKCGSTNVFWAFGLPQLWSIWQCRNCGYRGALILEDSRLVEKLRKDYARKIVKR